MTPAINLLKKKKIKHTVHQYHHDASIHSYGLEAVQKMAVTSEKIFKTLVVSIADKKLAVAIIPIAQTLSLKKIAKVLNAKKTQMADVADVLRSTGYVLGGVSPLGQKKRLQTVIDLSAKSFDGIYVSAGRRGLEIEISPLDLAELCQASFTELCN